MNMNTLSLADISTLPHDQLITLTLGQLLDLLAQAIEPLQARVDAVEVTTAAQNEKMAAMAARMAAGENLQEQDVTRIYCDIAQDRQRIARLEKPPEPQPTQKDRAEVLRALLVANGGKMLATDARKKMHLRKDVFSQLLNTCNFIERKPLHSDKRKVILILKSELV